MFVAGKYKTLCVQNVCKYYRTPNLTCLFVAGKYETLGEMFVSIIEFPSYM